MSKERVILICDDDRAIRTVLTQAFTRAGFKTRSTGAAATLWRWIEEGEGDLAVTDVGLPDGDALDMLPALRRRRPDLPVVAMSAQNTVMTAIRAAEAGAYDYLPKPFDLQELLRTARRALGDGAESRAPTPPADPQDETLPLIGRSAPMQEVYRAIARLMATDLTVMVTGASGSGKELVARALHDYGKRRKGPFVAVNMAAIPRDLLESELFGHERGAFTGAVSKTEGKFAQAQGGTLFLDEIGDMPFEAQTRLLRVLQDGAFTAVGGRGSVKTNVRIISATHQDLGRLIRDGRFREDLFYRLNVAPIRLPPLSERLDDAPDLARHFLRRAEQAGLPEKTFSLEALAALKTHDWPGNVRELENLVTRLAALTPDEVISRAAVEEELAAGRGAADDDDRGASLSDSVAVHVGRCFALAGGESPAPGLYDRILREIEAPLISLTLAHTGSNQLKAAEILGLNRNTLRKKIRELDICVERGKK